MSVAGAALTVGCQTVRLQQAAQPVKPLHLALLSDTHIPGDQKNGHRGFNPWENLKQIVPEVVAARPEGTIVCGDAARLDGQLADYAELRALLEPVAEFSPVYIGMGNHDDRANFDKVFPAPLPNRAGLKNKHVMVLEEEAVRVLLLDSLLYVNKVPGHLGQEQRNWLKEYLATKRDKPVVLFVHHTLGERDGDLLDSQFLFDIIAPHPQVKAIFYGHSHVWEITQRGGVRMINLPPVGYNFRDQDPVGWIDARFDAAGVDLTLRAFAGNRADDRKVTRVDWI